MIRPNRLLVVGNPEQIHIGAHLVRAALHLGMECTLCDVRLAFDAPRLITQLSWHLHDHKPPCLRPFGASVVQACRDFQPDWILSTGLAPLTAEVLSDIGNMGIARLVYLTDDPWNAAQHSRWFEGALREYDSICSPRSANLAQLRQLSGKVVTYVPFAYNPELHFREYLLSSRDQQQYRCDVVFFGGADSDRIPYIRRLVAAGMNVHLYGGYWNRYPDLRFCWRGHATASTLRKAVAGASITLCLVRRANRDGHVMRTYEAPAMGACMVTEMTEEHRAILGTHEECTLYFRDPDELIERVAWLLARPSEQTRMRDAIHARIAVASNTYTARLVQIVQTAQQITDR